MQHRDGIPLQAFRLVGCHDLHPVVLHRHRTRGQAVFVLAGEFEVIQQSVQACAGVIGYLLQQSIQMHRARRAMTGEHLGADAEDVDDVREQVT